MTTRKVKAAVTAAPVAPAQADLAALVAQMQAQLAALAAPAKQTTATKAAKSEKPKSNLDGAALYARLAGSAGTAQDVTTSGRNRITAFCADGSVVTIIAPR